MLREIRLFAEDEWVRRNPEAGRQDVDDTVPTAQEVRRVIRNMTGYAERQVTTKENGVVRRRALRPLDEVVPRFNSHAELAEHLINKANLSQRNQTNWWWDKASDNERKALKARFEAVNQGSESAAMLPRRMIVVVPNALPDNNADLDVELIDTRGLDESVESRGDLQDYLLDPRALVVLCSSFVDAPDEVIRGLLRSVASDARLRTAIPRTMLLLVDKGDSDQTNGADGDREIGRELKVDECLAALKTMPSPVADIERVQVVAFDVLIDDRLLLVKALADGLSRLRHNKKDDLRARLSDAQAFLKTRSDELRPRLLQRVDRSIRETMAQNLPKEAPLATALAGLYRAIEETRYASVIYASCRRYGTYVGLNLYDAIRAEASRAATAWLDGLVEAVMRHISSLDDEPELAQVRDYIRLTRLEFSKAFGKVTEDYASRVRQEAEGLLRKDPVWFRCSQEWGRGSGFKVRVLRHFQDWEGLQQRLGSYETTSAAKHIPFWSEVAQPMRAPAFALHVRNLRVLRRVDWTPEPLSVLVGANGTGKSTMFLVLKLLRAAYFHGLPEAVTQVLGGSANLRTLSVPDTEPIEVGIDMGDAKWRVRLVPRDGAVDYLTEENLHEGKCEVFTRNSLGGFRYNGTPVEPSPLLGLRVLMDRGVHEPAVRAIAAFLQRISVYHDPDLWGLRKQGSNSADDRVLHARGTNALALLRRWQQERANRHRYQFVLDGLNAAFPNTVDDMDFQEAGNTLAARFYRPGGELSTPVDAEANGVLQLLLLLCEVAHAEDESLVAIDEPENGLHPYALRAFLRRVESWAKQHRLTVLLATHSTVLLDELSKAPEKVFVMKPTEPDAPMPTALIDLCDKTWLERFELGELYQQGEIGSNEDQLGQWLASS